MSTRQFDKRRKAQAKRKRKIVPRSPGRGSLFPGKVEKLSVSMTAEGADRARAIARYHNCTVSDAVEAAVRAFPLVQP